METPQAPIPKALRKTILVVAIIITTVFGIFIFIIAPFIIRLDIVNWQARNLENKMFQKYEVFSKKIMPSNFILVETHEYPSTFSETTKVEQTFRVFSTRKEIIGQLEPLFKQYGFRTYIDNTIGSFHLYITRGPTIVPQYEVDDRWYLRNSTTSIEIKFFPDDTSAHPQPFPYKVEKITIWWSCMVGVQSCVDDKYLST